MKNLAKFAIGAIALTGAAVLTTVPADARVFVGVGVGPGYYGGPPYSAYCDPYSLWYDPYYCDGYGYDYGYPYYGYGYGGPVFFGEFGGGGHFHHFDHGGWGHGGWGGHGSWGGHGGWGGHHH